MNEADKNSYLAMIRHIAEEKVNRDASKRQMELSEHYLWLTFRRRDFAREVQDWTLRVQDFESWLDIYQHPIENMWYPGKVYSDDEDEDDEDNDDDEEDTKVRSHDSPVEESDEDPVPIVARRGMNEMNSEQRGSGRDPHHSDDEKIE